MNLSKLKTWRWINIVPVVVFIGLFLFEYLSRLCEHDGIVIFDYVLPLQYVIYFMCFTSIVLLVFDLILRKKALFYVAYGVSVFHCIYFAFCSYAWMIFNPVAMIGFVVDCAVFATLTIILLIYLHRNRQSNKSVVLKNE